MDYLINYALFLAKIITVVIAILISTAGILALGSKGKQREKGRIKIKKINHKFEKIGKYLQQHILNKKELKAQHKQEKLEHKQKKKQPASEATTQKRIFVIDFVGDIRASAVKNLREEVTAILTIAEPRDEVFVQVDSGGGMVHSYGLCASQLVRLRDSKIHLTVAVDKIAASGGYLMACVANQIIAAPFAIVGSIGVLAQVPNFNRFLKRRDIDFEQLSAGEYKRTLTMFGENNSKARKKMQQELEETLEHFKDFVSQYRPQINIDEIANGEHWLASKAKELHLVDHLLTSDDYLLKASKGADIYQVNYEHKKHLPEKLGLFANKAFEQALQLFRQDKNDHYLM